MRKREQPFWDSFLLRLLSFLFFFLSPSSDFFVCVVVLNSLSVLVFYLVEIESLRLNFQVDAMWKMC